MPLEQFPSNQSYFVSENKSVTFWAGSDSPGSPNKQIKYIVRDLSAETWGTQGLVIDGTSDVEFTNPIYGFTSSDFLFKRISDNKIFVAVRIPDGVFSLVSWRPVVYTFGTVSGTNITFSPYKFLRNSDDTSNVLVGYRSISALVVPDSEGSDDATIFVGYINDQSFEITKIRESGLTNTDTITTYGQADRYYTRLIKKDNLVLANGLKVFESSLTFMGKKPFIKAYNYDPSSKTLSAINGGEWLFDVPAINNNSNFGYTNVDIFFTGEDYNFMIICPDANVVAVPA